MLTFTDKPYAPTAYTKPLSEDFDSDGPALLRMISELGLTNEDSTPLVLDAFQEALVNHVLERLPSDDPFKRGPLRYRQCVISMGRQNGKSTIGSLLTLYGLFKHSKAPQVVGVASRRDQTKFVYVKAYRHIKQNPHLSRLVKATGTKGLMFRDLRGGYEVFPSSRDALQGKAVTFGICDELHIMKADVWGALLFGQSAQAKSMLIGITTAGDDNSTLLSNLYDQGYAAIADPEPEENRQFGFFLWEAPEGATLYDDEAFMEANPSVRCGRIPIAQARNAVLREPASEWSRFGLNRFVEALEGWVLAPDWIGLPQTPTEALKPGDKHTVFAVDRHGPWEYVSITASTKDDAGMVHTRVVASYPHPSLNEIIDECMKLKKANPMCVFVLDMHTMKVLAENLEKKGVTVKRLGSVDVCQASAVTLSLIREKRLAHDHNPLLRNQVPRGITKNVGDGFTVSRKLSLGETDTLFAMVLSTYWAEVRPKPNKGIF